MGNMFDHFWRDLTIAAVAILLVGFAIGHWL